MTPMTIWITGAGKGLGRALALELSARGHRIAASARTEDDLISLSREALAQGGVIMPYGLDVTDKQGVDLVMTQIVRDIGVPDLVVLNAGTHSEVTATNFDLAEFSRVIDTNIMGIANCLAVLLPAMIARKSGRIALMASVAGYRGLPTASAYSASKAAIIALAEALKPELEPHNVDLTLINPGFVDTPLTRRNTFPMPFLMEADRAAKIMADGLEAGKFEIVFPWQMKLLMKLLGVLPYPLFFAITRRLVR
jgi:short-subunit dehydrogenase